MKLTMLRRRWAVLAGVAAMAILAGPLAAAPMVVRIVPDGPETFLEGTVRSGYVSWMANEDLTIYGTGSRELTFGIGLDYTDPDNAPISPNVADLNLVGWTCGFASVLSWNFVHCSSSLDGPLDTYSWMIWAAPDEDLTFHVGDEVARASWTTGGEDLDNVPDSGSFEMSVQAGRLFHLTYGTAPVVYDTQTKTMNPEPLPEPGSILLTAACALFLGRRRERCVTGRGARSGMPHAADRRNCSF